MLQQLASVFPRPKALFAGGIKSTIYKLLTLQDLRIVLQDILILTSN